ncbi:RluA family pseudouridine synthase [Allorhodopirellula solitaria]|uniref:RluA family pseudouridine synthase n=1 Tax=Allorhodopirellula solitaria TaxID=2527987 RepID=UPI0011B54A35|nr:RNA pseudouridine synthase [Allorhodopirellula solitaria]
MIPILWQCRSAVVVVKPAGLSTTSPPGTASVEWRLREQLDRADGFLSAVHRLDRDVSGVLMIALSKKSARLLCEQFAARRVSKTYHAWVQGRLAPSASGAAPERWSDHVRKIEDVARGEVCGPDAPGAKVAETDVRSIRYDEAFDRTLIELKPITGRMHQLRLQTASRGHAILHDPIYGPAPSADPIALTAVSLAFHDPHTGVRTKVSFDRQINDPTDT